MLVPAVSSINLRDQWPDPIKGNLRVYAVNAAGFLFIYFYLGFGLADGNVSCYADPKSDVMANEITKSNETTIDGEHDIGEAYRSSFRALFYLTILQAAAWTGNHVKTDNHLLRQICIFTALGTMVIGISLWWMLFHTRESHAGSVCSGDYLGYGDST